MLVRDHIGDLIPLLFSHQLLRYVEEAEESITDIVMYAVGNARCDVWVMDRVL